MAYERQNFKNGQVLTAECLNRMEEGICHSGSDWNASEDEPGHVLNRTHWVERGRVEVLAECQPTYDADEGWFVLLGVPPLKIGKTYIVNWNGVEYTSIAQDGSAMGAGCILGDLGAMDGEATTGEPFIIITIPTDGGTVFTPIDGITELTVSIYQDGEVVHKLDPKFLPEQLFGSTEKQIEVLPETNLQFSQFSKQKQFENLPWEEPNQGKYIVYWHGVPYECAVQYATGDLAGATYKRIVLGDVSKLKGGAFDGIEGIDMNVESGEPFVINAMFITAPGGKLTQVTVHRFHDAEYPAETIPVRIILCEKGPNKMPIKYLPDGVPYVEDGGFVEVLGETTTPLSSDDFTPILIPSCPVSAGDTIVVNWNGKEYSCTGIDGATLNMVGAAIFGNVGALVGGENTGEPFVIALGEVEGQSCALTFPVDGSTEVTISIQKHILSYHKIDEKLLPDNTVNNVVVVTGKYGEKASHTGGEILHAAMVDRKAVFFMFSRSTLPLKYVSDTTMTATFELIYASENEISRNYVVVEADGTISTVAQDETVFTFA